MDANADDFSDAERSAMRLDGELFSVHGCYLPTDEPDVLSTRVRIAREGAPAHFVLDLMSAAWVWEATPLPPAPPQCCIDMAHRSTKIEPGTWQARHVHLKPGDVVRTAAGSLLSPWRTLMHLLRWPPPIGHEQLYETVALLVARERLTPAQAFTRFHEQQAANVRGQFAERFAEWLQL